jgi:hypothetical protein
VCSVKMATLVDINKSVAKENGFKFSDGLVVCSLHEFAEGLNDLRYAEHVKPGRNDFHNWIRDVFQYPELADKVASARNAWDVITMIRHAHHNRQYTDFEVNAPVAKILEGSNSSNSSQLHVDRSHSLISTPKKDPEYKPELMSVLNDKENVEVAGRNVTPQLTPQYTLPEEKRRELVKNVMKEDGKMTDTAPTSVSTPPAATVSNPKKEVMFWGIWDFILGIIVGIAIGYFLTRFLFP